MKTALLSCLAIAVALAAAGYYYAARPAAERTPDLPTAKVQRGNLVCTLKAKGTVKLEEVEVGAQVTGRIAGFGSDPADPNKPLDCGSHVHKGMMLAQIDPTIYQAQIDYADAALQMAKANLAQLRARLEQAEQEWKRAQCLRPAKAISDTDYGVALMNFRMTEANVKIGEAAVRQSEASLCIARTNLDYTVIRSPSDGVIIDRRVNVGQTVVASFNAPGLFLIAKDSPHLQVWASVDESDIGSIRLGTPVQFAVNAYGDESFDGKVSQVRLSPTKRGDSVAYMVVVAAENTGSILPDMTANLQFEIDRRQNVLLIPNDVLKPLPLSLTMVADTQWMAPNEATGPAPDEKSVSPAKRSGGKKCCKSRRCNRQLLVKDSEGVRPIEVQVGASNGAMTEVTGSNVKEGMEVIRDAVCLRDGT